MAMWNPWRGCHRFSEGCRYCYIHKGDAKRGICTDKIVRLEGFDAPVAHNAKGEYKIKPGQMVYLCFSTDFLIEEADPWRDECWRMMREREDLHFLFLTKRICRLEKCLPDDWGKGYDNVTIGCTVEDQAAVEQRLPIFNALPVRHRNITLQPMIGPVNIEKYLDDVELVVLGGESDVNARPLDYDWVLDVRQQCMRRRVAFEFRQCGSNFIKDGKMYYLNVRQLCAQARKAGINYAP